ncbi:pectinesterase-like [Primulina tabacum]|uniref:pectinesterase-like n=1 Tax=Primulina tabacum TaxID=48773 RepID=UPI003F5A545F
MQVLSRKNSKRSMEKQLIVSYVCIVLSLISALRGVYPQRTFIVAKDGSGNFTTISQAISEITYIEIRAGIYHENVFIPKEKINLYLVGDGIDKTRISGNRSENMGFLTYDTATVRVAANGFVAKEVTFENTAGVNMNQSVAVTIEGLYSAFYRCRFLGYQDTLYVWQGIQFFRECDIYGTVDFIFGESRALFQNCNVYARRPSTRAVEYHHGARKRIRKSFFRHRDAKLHYCSCARSAAEVQCEELFRPALA